MYNSNVRIQKIYLIIKTSSMFFKLLSYISLENYPFFSFLA